MAELEEYEVAPEYTELTVEKEEEEEEEKQETDDDEEVKEEEIKPIRLHIDPSPSRSPPLKSVEGWIILVTGIHQEAEERDIHDIFADFGEIKNLHVNYDRCTGFTKGYALIEYVDYTAACNAMSRMNGVTLFSQILNVDWAFRRAPIRGYIGRSRFVRSRSPGRRY